MIRIFRGKLLKTVEYIIIPNIDKLMQLKHRKLINTFLTLTRFIDYTRDSQCSSETHSLLMK